MNFLHYFFLRLFHQPEKPATPSSSVPPPEPGAEETNTEEKPEVWLWWTGPEHFAMRTGVRNRNPLNVKAGSDHYWRNQAGRDERGHALFADPRDGIRAAAVLLRTYYRKYGLRTVHDILSRWAPVSDTIGSRPGAPANSPVEYAAFVRKRTGIAPFERLALFTGDGEVDDAQTLAALLGAMAEYEIGAGFRLSDEVLAEGIARV